MGRWSRATTTRQALRIELSSLLKKKLIVKGSVTQASFSWSNGSSIGMVSNYDDDEIWIQLNYTLTDEDDVKHKYNYKIHLTTLPSNLGKGEVLYFVCPSSGKRCRILYKAYGYHKWKSRESYQNRIYYPLQTENDRYYSCEAGHRLGDRIDELRSRKKRHKTHLGKPTKKELLIQKLEAKKDYHDEIWNRVYSANIMRLTGKFLYG